MSKRNVTKPSVTIASKDLITYLLVREQSGGIRDCVHYLSVGITTLTTAWDKICEESSSNIKIYPSHVTKQQTDICTYSELAAKLISVIPQNRRPGGT